MATTTVKGLLKGLRYISRIFDDEDKRQEEMTIGFPTDVKHVAHIGWDGPTVNPPTWMNEFKKNTSPSSPGGGWRSDRTRAISAEDLTPTSGASHEKMSSRCRRATCSSPLAEEYPPQRSSNNSKPSRHSRRQDYSDAAVASPSKDEVNRRGKKQQHHTVVEYSASVPKPNQGGQRKSKGSSGSGEARRSSGRRTKHSSSTDSLPDLSKVDPEHHSLPIIREKRSKEPTKLRKDPTTPSSRRKSSTSSHDFGSKPPHVAKEIEGLS